MSRPGVGVEARQPGTSGRMAGLEAVAKLPGDAEASPGFVAAWRVLAAAGALRPGDWADDGAGVSP